MTSSVKHRPLAAGVRHRGDLRMGEGAGHPQGQRAPAASEFKDGLPVSQIGMRNGLAQRLLLGLLKRGVRFAVKAGRIFPVRTEHLCEEGGGHLVMLRIRFGGMLGDGARGHIPRKGGVGCRVARGKLSRRARAKREAEFQI